MSRAAGPPLLDAEPPTTVALYVRVSRGEATRGQRETLLAWARREGWRVVVRYENRASGMDGSGCAGCARRSPTRRAAPSSACS